MTTTTPQQALQQLETFVQANPDLAKEEPEAWAKLTRVRDVLKKQPAAQPNDEVKKLISELFRWQLELQRADYAEQLAAATKAFAETPGPALEKVKLALGEMVKFLDEAKAAGFPPSDKAAAALEKSGARVEQAFAEVERATSTSTEGLAMKPVKRPIVSSQGVPLKAAEPPARPRKK